MIADPPPIRATYTTATCLFVSFEISDASTSEERGTQIVDRVHRLDQSWPELHHPSLFTRAKPLVPAERPGFRQRQRRRYLARCPP